MLALKYGILCLLYGGLTAVVQCINHGQALIDWNNYKATFNKDYTNSETPEAYAQYYYKYNKNMINSHNMLQASGRSTYTLRENQFTDMRLIHFNALLPVAKQLTQSNAVTPLAVQDAPAQYSPVDQLGLESPIEDQGSVCSSSWAYAAAKAIELLQATQTGNISPQQLSAQNLLDCAGQSTACTTQVPQTGYDYLTQYAQDLHTQTDYPNNNTLKEPGMCVPQSATALVVQLASYARLSDGDDASLLKYVGAGYPVIVEYNPTSFEFMHYDAGIFQQPTVVQRGSHFMVVIGYGTDATSGLDYWLVQNSFGTTWGEKGFIRILRNPKSPLAKNAIFPYEFK